VKYFDSLVRRQDPKVRINPPGFLVVAVREDLAAPAKPPVVVVSTAPMTPPSHRRLIVTEPPSERKRIDAYWASLNDDQRQTIERAAFQSAKPFLLEAFQRAKKQRNENLVSVYRQSILDAYITGTRENSVDSREV
jgi:hypothetical protein